MTERNHSRTSRVTPLGPASIVIRADNPAPGMIAAGGNRRGRVVNSPGGDLAIMGEAGHSILMI